MENMAERTDLSPLTAPGLSSPCRSPADPGSVRSAIIAEVHAPPTLDEARHDAVAGLERVLCHLGTLGDILEQLIDPEYEPGPCAEMDAEPQWLLSEIDRLISADGQAVDTVREAIEGLRRAR